MISPESGPHRGMLGSSLAYGTVGVGEAAACVDVLAGAQSTRGEKRDATTDTTNTDLYMDSSELDLVKGKEYIEPMSSAGYLVEYMYSHS